MDLVFAGHRCCDHSPSGGYDQVCALFPEAGWLSGPALEAGRVEWIREPRTRTGLSNGVFHVFYGDCSGKRLPALLRTRFPGSVIVSSAHQPAARLAADESAWTALEASDAVITVSRVQARELVARGLRAPVRAIPHGVWTHTFSPGAAAPGVARSTVMMVGSFLRDWSGARQVAAALAQAGVRPVALGAGPREHLAGEDLPLDVLPRVAEEELVRMYHTAAAVFLPFQEATASNALLEAMAAGCPVVCPRIPTIVDEYLGDAADCYEPGRYDRAAARLLHYVRDPASREKRSQQLLARATAFEWSALKRRFDAVYQEAAAHTGAYDRSARAAEQNRHAHSDSIVSRR